MKIIIVQIKKSTSKRAWYVNMKNAVFFAVNMDKHRSVEDRRTYLKVIRVEELATSDSTITGLFQQGKVRDTRYLVRKGDVKILGSFLTPKQ